jgi:ubiquinone/menaquinone biosynthesis C-methylase UbiE
MKVRESGMPAEDWWSSFFNPDLVLRELGLEPSSRVVVDMGSGYGTFTIPAAKEIRGTVYALDFDPQMVAACQEKVKAAGIQNVICRQCDFVTQGTGLADGSADFVMLFNILHAENPVDLLKETNRILAPDGKVGVIHWNYDPTTPRGPSMEIRPLPEQCQEWIQWAGFRLVKPLVDFPPYHYGMVGQKGAPDEQV